MIRHWKLLILASLLMGCRFFQASVDPFYNAVLKAEPHNPGAVYLQGQRYLTQGQYRNASIYFERMTRIAPDDPGGWIGLGQAELELEHPRAAEKAFRRARALSSKPLSHAEFGLASALIFQNKLDAARQQIEKIEKDGGVSASTERLRGDMAFMAGKYEESRAHYQKSLAILPNQPDLQPRIEDLNKYINRKS